MSEQETGRGKREAGAVVAMATRRRREDGLERASVTVFRTTLINVVVAYIHRLYCLMPICFVMH
jgi:hypothetical protein